MTGSETGKKSVPITVVIPTYNSARTLPKTLEGLEQQSRDDFEVVVVDDGSRDSPERVAESFNARGRLNITFLRQENAGPAKARNAGAHSAQGTVVIFLDADCVPPPNWVEAMVSPLGPEIAACHAPYQIANPESVIARFADYEITRRWERQGDRITAMGGHSTSIIKEVFLQIGGFDTAYRHASGEDFDLAFRLVSKGYAIAFSRQTFVYHYHPTSLRRYVRQQYVRGYWRGKLYLDHPRFLRQGESYSGYEAQIHFVLTTLAFLSLPLAVLVPYLPAGGLALLLAAQLPLALWCFRREKKFLVLALLLGGLRSAVATMGAYVFFARRVLSYRKGS